MGNRAVITTKDDWNVPDKKGIGIYVHWNGGRDSVEGFLTYCKLRGFRPPERDDYGWARLCQIIANFFGGDGCSIGIDRLENLDLNNYDNGVYITKEWNIIGREYFKGEEQQEYGLRDMLSEIDIHQPDSQWLGMGMIEALLETNTAINDVSDLYFYNMSKRLDFLNKKLGLTDETNGGKPFSLPMKKEVSIYGKKYIVSLEERNGNFIHGTTKYPTGYEASCSWRVYPWRDGSESIVFTSGIKDEPPRGIHSME